MEQLLLIVQVFLLGVVSWSHYGISGSVLAVTVRPGDNITLHCDCKMSTGIYTVWFRNWSHENQPTLVLSIKTGQSWKYSEIQKYSHYKFVKNSSSDSYDLLIVNVTESDEGIYYCGTEETTVEQEKKITSKVIYRYSNTTTRLTIREVDVSQRNTSHEVSVVAWMLVFTPAFTILSSFLTMILVYLFCQKTEEVAPHHQERLNAEEQRKSSQDEDRCVTRVVFRPQNRQTRSYAGMS